MTVVQILASGGLAVLLVLSGFHVLIWRTLRQPWAAWFALGFGTVSVVFTMVVIGHNRIALTEPPLPLNFSLVSFAIVAMTFGFLDHLRVDADLSRWIRRVTVGVALLMALSVIGGWINRGMALLIVSLFGLLWSVLCAQAIFREPNRGHGVVMLSLLFYPAALLTIRLGYVSAEYLNVAVVFPLAVLGVTTLYAGLRREHDQLMTELAARERAEAALRSNEDRLRYALDATGDGFWDLDFRTGKTLYSRRWKEIIGYAEDEIGSGSEEWTLRIHPDDFSQVMEKEQACIDGRSDAFVGEFRMRAKDGRWVWILDRGKVVTRGPQGEALRMIGTHTDISERKWLELREASDSNVMMLIAKGAELPTILDSIVRGVEALSHWRCSILLLDAEGRHMKIGAAPSLPEAFNRVVDGLAIGPEVGSCGRAMAIAARVITPDIRTDPLWAPFRELAERSHLRACWSEPIMGASGVVLGTFGVYHDQPCVPTEAETASIVKVAQMASVAIERRRAEAMRLALEAQLREAQKLEAIGTLAGGIAHDFNNIVAAILGNVAFARQDIPPDHLAQGHLSQIHKAGHRARSLVQQILAFSRKQSGDFDSLALRPLVEETLGMLRSLVGGGVKLIPALHNESLTVRGNSNQLQQVLMNLVMNAWQALPAGRGRIEVGMERVAADALAVPAGLPDGGYAHLWVRDDGVGMSRETRAHIFEPFFTTKPVGQGTGLGLAVVHGIVEAHGGAIAVTTELGQGSTFDLYLPLVDAGATSAAAPTLGVPVGRGRGQHVLYVDDDDVMAVMVHDLLLRLGYRATCVHDGASALDVLAQNPGDVAVVVTDFNMPGFSGLDLARTLADAHPDLPVVISSGYISEELRASAAQLGVFDLLHKEETVEKLGPMVRAALGDRCVTVPGELTD